MEKSCSDAGKRRLCRRRFLRNHGRDPTQGRLLARELRELLAGLAVGDCGRDELGESGETLLGAVGGRFPRAGRQRS